MGSKAGERPRSLAATAKKPSKARAGTVKEDRGAKLQTLQTALAGAVGAKAVLNSPGKLVANRPADVSLSLPADFAETVRSEAGKVGLADAAASANVTALLSGDGYAITPDETQSQPLTVGQPTEFHWTVTAQPDAKGPLRADVGADLLGGGSETLSLGTVVKSGATGFQLTPRAIGAIILALIVILVLAWLGRGRSTPARPVQVRRREDYTGRPLDIDRT